MLFILTSFFVFTLSNGWTEIDSIIQYTSDSGNAVGWEQEYKELDVSGQSEDCFFFNSDCCSSVNMQMEDYEVSGKSRENFFFDSATPSNLLSFNLRSSHDGTKDGYYTGRHRVYLQYVPEYFVFMEGCFGSATGCRSSIINDVGTEYHIYLISVILYFQINSQTKIHFHNEKSSRYLYVDGIASQDVTTYLQYTPTQTGYYLMTGKNINSLTMANTSYSIQSVCNRNEVNRYYLYSSIESSTNNCVCVLTSGTTIGSTGVFDHPDCVRNNTYFDLDLSTLSSTTITFNGLNTWYSLLFPTTLTITNSESVVITDLVLESGHTIEFSGDVEVTNLEINSVGDYAFNSINFTTSSLSEGIDDDDILFKQTSINNDLYDSNVNRCTCVKNGDSYDDGIGDSFTDCLSYKSFSNNILNLKVSSSYETFSTEYWNILYFNTVTSTLTASFGSLIFTTCNFTSVNVTIDVSSSINEFDVNVLFNGLFVLDENVVLMMNSSIKSNSFAITSDNAIVYISDVLDELILTISTTNKLLLIGNGVGFSQQQLTTKTTTQTTTISSDSLCNSLLYSLDNNECILCDGLVDQNGYCFNETSETIYKCISKTEFGCEECYEGYESKLSYCNECSSNCLRCYNDECINCEMNYQLNETNHCELISDPIISFDNNKTMKCSDGYYSNGECIKCSDSNCITCNSSQCLTCNTNYTLNNGNCQITEPNNGEEIRSNYGVIDCDNGYYSNNSECIKCSLTFDNCELCNINSCLSCLNGVLIDDGSCSINTDCLNIDYSICLSCNDNGNWFNGNECISCGDNCKNCINGYCIECNDDYILQSDNNCIENEYPDNCITLSYYGTCQRCSNGYYLNNNLCYDCSNECTTCHNLTYCFECNDGYMLNSNNECVDISESNANCKTAIPGSSGGCAICNDGYYRNQTSCLSCISNCNKCNNGESCISCESNYFLLNDASECISYDDLTNCETKTQSGCTKCINDGYYLNNQYCISCSDTTENCNTCNNNGECLTCQNGHILINYECINYQLIDNCKESNDSKCTSCSFWHTLNEDQTGCDTQVVWWVIVLIGLVILIIMIGICVLILYVTKLLLDWRKQQKQRQLTTIFSMKTSNIQFQSTNNQDVVINKNEILFNDECDEIGVNEETRDLICVGNTSKHTIKVQFSVKDGKAIEFEIFIKPLCTCKINDQIMLISVDLSKGKTITTPITINTITIMTTRLDYSELIEDVKLGEGSFGIVYKGTFRANQVAIKKLKDVYNNSDAIDEFNKEVSMLDKFRNDYIVHFYGAVFIPTKICMVTEFAQYGISYLHSNGILHRDIKPDNFLILSLENDVQVNAKLTDFGSSRNINMLMTNMTFTKGIGTPKYMAPEILDRNKYKKPSDIYSFAITIYETMIWDNAYPKTQFEHPWSIADFISNGNRLPKPSTMNETIYSLISNCWKHESNSRYTIEEVVKKLEQMT
ncbi:Protein serine/threonine kinase [Entamoeba marina]